MSGSSFRLENAAPTAPVNGSESNQNKSQQPWNLPPRAKSASLLTQALTTNHETDEPSATAYANAPSTIPPVQASCNDSRRIAMAGVGSRGHASNTTEHKVPAGDAAGDIRASMSLGATPRSTATISNVFDMRGVDSLLMSHRDLMNTSKARGTSLERTNKEKRVQELPEGIFSTQSGSTGLSQPATPSTPPSTSAISPFPPTEGVRATYRSWRDARPATAAEKAWSIGEHGSHDTEGGQVEKSIAEALAGIEPNNRSRKASHSLRFFREGLPEDKLVKRDSKSRGRSKEELCRGKSFHEMQSSGPQSPREDGTPPTSSPSFDKPKAFEPIAEHAAHVAIQGLKHVANSSDDPASKEGYFDSSHATETVSKEQLEVMPPQLLADIRKNHNLTPGATKGSSFSRSIPVTASERPQSYITKSESTGEGPIVTPGVKVEKVPDGRDESNVKVTDEEDDSGEEQISSALFVPHKLHHEAPDRETLGSHEDLEPSEIDQQNSQWLEEHAVPSCDVDEKYLSQDFRSELPLPNTAIKPPTIHTEPAVTRSDAQDYTYADRDSEDEGGYTTLEEDSGVTDNDQETTPTGSLKHGSRLPIATTHGLHDHQQKRKQPLDTIELIPYRHQVGGHTTMWRFSKRAVCKQLNNQENKFYETVESFHPELLKFLPRYVSPVPVSSLGAVKLSLTKT